MQLHPYETELINDSISGYLCRCTGYRPIIDAAKIIDNKKRNDQFRKNNNHIKIEGEKILNKISRENKPYVIAELSANHNGSIELAKKSIEKAYKAAGVELAYMDQNDFNAWLEIAKKSSYKNFADKVPGGQKLIDMALAVK